jgi:aspartokinase-like uncharacterized kinase
MTSRASGRPTTHGWREGRLSGQGAAGRPLVMQPQVIKIGGSLLARPRWPEELAELLVGRDEPLVVVGGGSVVDGLRAVDATSPRSPELVHELAIAAMGITGRLVADALGLPVVQAPGLQAGVLDMAAWLAASPQGDVPASWDVTSDSLAAVLARATGCGLMLVKSVPPPAALDLDALAAAGWVDAYFPRLAASLAEITWAAPAAR